MTNPLNQSSRVAPKERPILMSGPMVRALLDGRKTQTRRVVKGLPAGVDLIEPLDGYPGEFRFWRNGEPQTSILCPYGVLGERLYVKETWAPDPPDDGTWAYTAWSGCSTSRLSDIPERSRHPAFCNYRATWLHGDIRWTPAIHMPRWASRIPLELTDVRVQRLQDISEEDAKAEGAMFHDGHGVGHSGWRHDPEGPVYATARESFAALWNSINAKPKAVTGDDGDTSHYVSYPWSGDRETRTHRGKPWYVIPNPWVWPLTFRRCA